MLSPELIVQPFDVQSRHVMLLDVHGHLFATSYNVIGLPRAFLSL